MAAALHLIERRGARQQQYLVGDLRGGGPDLGAVDDVAIAAAIGTRGDLGGVEAGVGLRDAKARLVLAGDDRGQHAALLCVGAEHHHRVEAEDVEVDGRCAGHAGTGLGDRLHQYRGFRDAETGPAICFRHGDAEPVAVCHGGEEGVGEGRRPVTLQPVRIVEAGADLQHLFADLLLFCGEGEVHGRAFQTQAWWTIFVPRNSRR